MQGHNLSGVVEASKELFNLNQLVLLAIQQLKRDSIEISNSGDSATLTQTDLAHWMIIILKDPKFALFNLS